IDLVDRGLRGGARLLLARDELVVRLFLRGGHGVLGTLRADRQVRELFRDGLHAMCSRVGTGVRHSRGNKPAWRRMRGSARRDLEDSDAIGMRLHKYL